MMRNTDQRTRQTPRGLACPHLAGRPANSGVLFAEGTRWYGTTGRWRG